MQGRLRLLVVISGTSGHERAEEKFITSSCKSLMIIANDVQEN